MCDTLRFFITKYGAWFQLPADITFENRQYDHITSIYGTFEQKLLKKEFSTESTLILSIDEQIPNYNVMTDSFFVLMCHAKQQVIPIFMFLNRYANKKNENFPTHNFGDYKLVDSWNVNFLSIKMICSELNENRKDNSADDEFVLHVNVGRTTVSCNILVIKFSMNSFWICEIYANVRIYWRDVARAKKKWNKFFLLVENAIHI